MERIEGMVSDIVFKNEENGYTIAHLANSENEVVIVGCMPTLSVGESIEVEGKWINHKLYGTQFEVSKFMPVTPTSLEGIYVYLSSFVVLKVTSLSSTFSPSRRTTISKTPSSDL